MLKLDIFKRKLRECPEILRFLLVVEMWWCCSFFFESKKSPIPLSSFTFFTNCYTKFFVEKKSPISPDPGNVIASTDTQ